MLGKINYMFITNCITAVLRPNAAVFNERRRVDFANTIPFEICFVGCHEGVHVPHTPVDHRILPVHGCMIYKTWQVVLFRWLGLT